jgi:hypothetical protein
MDFRTLKYNYNWKEIKGCPGRFVLKDFDKTASIDTLLDDIQNITHIKSLKVPDEIIIVRFIDGGIISYKKIDGTFVHTLNTLEGFERKLKVLGIDPDTIE